MNASNEKKGPRECQAVVIGASSGGPTALGKILVALPKRFPFSIMIVLHRGPTAGDYLERSLDAQCRCQVKQAHDKEVIETGTVYFAPPDYHLLVEDDGTLSLSVDPPVNYSRPSVDVLFESASDQYGAGLVGIVLTGANNDGSRGLTRIGKRGGQTVVQDPEAAEAAHMPRSAIGMALPDLVLPVEEISRLLLALASEL